MIINCFRCDKKIDRPGLIRRKTDRVNDEGKPIFKNIFNADYILIKDAPEDGTHIICPDCYNSDTDSVIWGVHKK